MVGPRSSSFSQQVASLGFNFVSAIAVTLINKVCFARVSFGFPVALCSVHYAFTMLGLEILRRAGMFEAMATQPSIRDPQYCVMVVVMGVVTGINNLSLLLNSVVFYQIFKLLSTPAIVGLEYALDGTLPSYTRRFWLAMVCVGVLATGKQDLQFSLAGTVAAAVWVPLAAVYKVQWSRLLRQYDSGTPAMLYAILPGAAAVQLLMVPVMDPPGLLEFEWTVEGVFWISMSGVAAFLVNLSGFLVLGNVSAIGHTLLGQLKSCVIVLGAWVMF